MRCGGVLQVEVDEENPWIAGKAITEAHSINGVVWYEKVNDFNLLQYERWYTGKITNIYAR